jgi:hypothetical protein
MVTSRSIGFAAGLSWNLDNWGPANEFLAFASRRSLPVGPSVIVNEWSGVIHVQRT